MRRLLPTSDTAVDAELTDEELLAEYRYPDDGTWLRANMVGSIDGVATVQGLSDGLSGAADKRLFGLLRALCDVVLVGAGTARAENYRGVKVPERFAGVRASSGQQPVPPIAMISRSLGLDPAARVFTETTVRPIVLTCGVASDERRAVLADVADVVVVGDAEVDLAAARDALHERGLDRILCEGGPTLLHDLVLQDMLDELCLTSSSTIVGGGERHVLNGPPLTPPRRTRLAALLEDDGTLFARYLLER